MSKNIVICCDGTGNEFGEANSNVVKLFSVLQIDPASQLAYYDPGLGTMGAHNALTAAGKWFTRVLGLAFGYGLSDNIADAYSYLMQTWKPGDRLFLFGFSRGAYTVRALASMLHLFGLLPPDNQQLVPYILRSLKKMDLKGESLARQFKGVFSSECKPHFVGVWDTVSSVGWIADPLKLRYTANNPDMRVGRHAVSIDERRCFFRQNLWGAPVDGQDIKQVWFAGVHSDVGGGYSEKESALSKIPLEWMIGEAGRAGLVIDHARAAEVLGKTPGSPYVKPDAAGEMHNSLTGFWRALEYLPRRHWNAAQAREEWIIPRGRPRTIRDGAVVHQAVLDRMASSSLSYKPKLPSRFTVEPWPGKASGETA
jgi:uncharacterized protein (DUF2235 family)